MTDDVTAHCPHCPRREPFDDAPTAQAWLTGHILEEHDGTLPDIGGVDPR